MALAELLRTALANHPGVEQVRAESEALAASIGQEAALPNPELGLSGGSKQGAAGQGPVLGASLSQALPLFGKRGARLRLAGLQAKAAGLRARAAEASLARELLIAAAEHAAARGRWRQLLERRKRLEPVKGYLATQTFAAPQQRADRAVVEARLRNLEAEGAHLVSEVSATAEALFGLAGLEGDGHELRWDLPGAGEAWDTRIPEAGFIEAENPDLDLARLELEQALAVQELSQKTGLPDPEFSVSYGREQAGDEEQSLVAGLALPLPLLNRNQQGVAAAAGGLRAAKAREAALKRGLKSKRRALARRLEGLAASASAFNPEAMERLEGQLAEAEHELKRGRLPLLSYLELEDEAARTRMSVLSVTLETFKSLAEAHALAGGTSLPAAWAR